MSLLPQLIAVIAHLPLLVVYFQQLWDRPHYQFFPLVFGAVGYFVWQRWPDRQPIDRRGQFVADMLMPVCAGLLSVAFLRLSPMLAYVSFVLIVASTLLRLGVRAVGPWLLLWLVVRVPYGWDIALIQWMQRLTTRLSSTALDSIGVEHIADGNVLLFPTTSLFVEEACSGVVSLLAIVACAGILAVWWRRAIVHSLLLLGVGIFLAGAMNVVRVVTIAVALDGYQIDLTDGWRHEGLGLCIFAVSLIALFSADRLLYFLLAPISMNPLATYWDDVHGNFFVKVWNRYIGLDDPGHATISYSEEASLDDEVRGSQGVSLAWRWGFAALFVLVGGGQVIAGIGPFSVAPEVSPFAINLDEESLPPSWQQWKRIGFEPLERDSSSAFGERSRIWAYSNGTMTVRISLDFVFPEWHALSACYQGVGWTLDQRDRMIDVESGTAMTATFSKPNGERALLMFDLFDDAGNPYEAPAGSFVHPQLRRVLNGENSRWNLPNYYQVQALSVTRSDKFHSSQREAVEELFVWFRERMVEQVAGGTAQPSPAQAETHRGALRMPQMVTRVSSATAAKDD